MSFLGERNAIALGVSQHAVLNSGPLLTRLSPSLLLQFAGAQTLDPRITFTRSTTATYFNQSGVLSTAAINEPRFDYNPVTLAPLGLLIEEQRTNLLTYSAQFDNAAWTKSNSSVTANTIVAPDGNVTGDKLVENTNTSTHFIEQSATVTTSAATTFSFFAKAAERIVVLVRFTDPAALGNRAEAKFNLSTGAITDVINVGATTGATASITFVGNGWYRCVLTATINSGTSASGRCFLVDGNGNQNYTGDGYSGIYIWGAQLEAGAFPTSYIPTVASQVTRAADVAVMTGTNFSSWYNATEGTWFADFTPATSSYLANKNVFLASDGTTSNFNGLRYVSSGAAPGLGVTAAGVTQASLSTGAMVANTTYKMAGAYKLNDFAVSRNGAAVVVDTSGTIPTVTQAEIGTLAGLNVGTQHIRRIAYYPRRLANSELQAITA